MRLTLVYLLAARGTGITVVLGIYVADTDLCLKVPVPAEYPCVAVGYAGACKPALKPLV